MTTTSSRNATRYDRKVVMKPPISGSDRGRDGRRGSDQGVRRLLRRAFEVAVDQRLHGGQQE